MADQLQARTGVAARLHSLLFNEHTGGSLGSFGANTTLKHDQQTTSIPRKTLPWWLVVGVEDVDVDVGAFGGVYLDELAGPSQNPELWLSGTIQPFTATSPSYSPFVPPISKLAHLSRKVSNYPRATLAVRGAFDAWPKKPLS